MPLLTLVLQSRVVSSCQLITPQQMSLALMMSRPSLRRITAWLHIHHIMNKVLRILHYARSRWTSDTYLMQFLKRYRKGEMRQQFFSIFQITAYFNARFLINYYKRKVGYFATLLEAFWTK